MLFPFLLLKRRQSADILKFEDHSAVSSPLSHTIIHPMNFFRFPEITAMSGSQSIFLYKHATLTKGTSVLKVGVADPDPFDTDPDPAFQFHTDPDPTV